MNEKTGSTLNKPRFTTLQVIGIILGIAVLAAVGWFIVERIKVEDEPPIRVRNGGSMFIELMCTSDWAEEGLPDGTRGWVPSRGVKSSDFLVTVVKANGDVEQVTRKHVTIKYNDDVQFEFSQHPSRSKTMVPTRPNLIRQSQGILKYDVSGSYIKEIKGTGGGPPWNRSYGPSDLFQVVIDPAGKTTCCP